ncbi:hypothetical protein ACFE04_022680 [Oxalis oulophora]
MDHNNNNRLKLPPQRRHHELNGEFNNDTNHHHPPPQQQPPPYYHRHHSSSSASFKGCCCCLFLLISFLLLLLLAIFLIIILAIKPKKPEFDLNQVGVQYIGITQMDPATSATTTAGAGATITLTIHLMFTADNPNAVGIKYGESKFTVMYRGMPLGKAVVPGFYQSAHSNRHVEATIAVDRVNLLQADAANLIRDASLYDRVELRLLGDVGAKIRVFNLDSPGVQENVAREIVLKATGRAINKTVMIAELIKRRVVGLHQDTSIGSIDITDTWEPLEEGLLPLETTRHVSLITITLSKSELNTSSVGYQPPIPADQVKPLADNGNDGEGSPGRRGRGRGGQGRFRGNSNGAVDHNINGNQDGEYESGGQGRGRGRGRRSGFRGRGRVSGGDYTQQDSGVYNNGYEGSGGPPNYGRGRGRGTRRGRPSGGRGPRGGRDQGFRSNNGPPPAEATA